MGVMTSNPKISIVHKAFIVLAVVVMVAGVCITSQVSYATTSEQGFKITKSTRFYIATSGDISKGLLNTVKTADSQFAAAKIPSSNPLAIAYGDASGHQSGDIVVSLVDSKKNRQAFDITTDGDGSIAVTASGTDGILYGLDTLLQKFMSEGNSLVGVDISESPDSKERTLLLDCGRKYYSAEWIENLIKRMSWQKYTSLELHFSDTKGMRLESKTFPWLNEKKGEYLTYEDMESICKTAKKYHIEIIPDFDSPGHMDYIIEKYAAYVKAHPDYTFKYDGKVYSSQDEGFTNISNYYMHNGAKSDYNNTGIDISNPVAVAFTSALIDEYADFFARHGSTKFNIGGDELFGWTGTTVGGVSYSYANLWGALDHWQSYAREELGIKNGSAIDAFITYLNTLAGHLEKMGYTCRVWNNELHRTDDQSVELDQNISIVYWSNDYEPMKNLAANGNKIYNTNTGWCYYVIRQDKKGGDIMDRTRKRCNGKNIFENWNPRNCANPKGKETLIPKKSYGGSYFAIWADSPEYKTESEVYNDTTMRTWANSAKMWNSHINDDMSYTKFKSLISKVGDFPGYNGNSSKASTLPDSGKVTEAKVGVFSKVSGLFKKLF